MKKTILACDRCNGATVTAVEHLVIKSLTHGKLVRDLCEQHFAAFTKTMDMAIPAVPRHIAPKGTRENQVMTFGRKRKQFTTSELAKHLSIKISNATFQAVTLKKAGKLVRVAPATYAVKS